MFEVPEGGSSEEEEDDAEAALKKEVERIRASAERGQQRRFTAMDSGANNVVFIRTHGVGESTAPLYSSQS